MAFHPTFGNVQTRPAAVQTAPVPITTDDSEFPSDISDLLNALGFGSDITSIEQLLSSQGISAEEAGRFEPLFNVALAGAAGIQPQVQSLIGQAQGTFQVGQQAAQTGLTSRLGSIGLQRGQQIGGLQQAALGQASQARQRAAASGFAGSGAGLRAQSLGRRQLGQQQQNIFQTAGQQRGAAQGAFGAQLGQLGQTLSGSLLGAERTGQQLLGQILGGLGGNLNSLLAALINAQAGDLPSDPSIPPPPPSDPFVDPGGRGEFDIGDGDILNGGGDDTFVDNNVDDFLALLGED